MTRCDVVTVTLQKYQNIAFNYISVIQCSPTEERAVDMISGSWRRGSPTKGFIARNFNSDYIKFDHTFADTI